MVTEDLHGICLKFRQLPIELNVPNLLTHMIYFIYTPFYFFPSGGSGGRPALIIAPFVL